MSVRRSSIAWCDYSGGDANFIIRGKRGECECSPGCANCYARDLLERFSSGPELTTFYLDKFERLAQQRFEPRGRPFRRGPDARPLVFVCDIGDWLHPRIPDHLARGIVARLAVRCDVDWLLLTKRAERLPRLFRAVPPIVWLGVTIEEPDWEWRLAELAKVEARVRWLSLEPLLGAVDPVRATPADDEGYAEVDAAWDVAGESEPEEFVEECELEGDWVNYGQDLVPNPEHDEYHRDRQRAAQAKTFARTVQWVVAGGESGPRRRALDLDWVRRARDQCQTAGVPFFYKQGSALRPGQDCLLDGREWREFPA